MVDAGADYLHLDVMDGCVLRSAPSMHCHVSRCRQPLCAQHCARTTHHQEHAQAHQGLLRCVAQVARRRRQCRRLPHDGVGAREGWLALAGARVGLSFRYLSSLLRHSRD